MILLISVDLDPGLAALRPLGGFSILHVSTSTSTSTHASRSSLRLPTLAQAYARGCGDATPDVHVQVGEDPLAFRVQKVAAALRAPETRVAASVAHQGLAARLWSVTLGCAALYGGVPDLAPALLRWDPDAGAPDDLWLAEVRPLPGDVATIAEVVLHGHLAPWRRPCTPATASRPACCGGTRPPRWPAPAANWTAGPAATAVGTPPPAPAP
ncbi:hypothetical protein GCM10022384_50220 [Streptomyces marokkonensis]|uniref:Uncharacterized protein n=1 Tax=Streptomyces marokkonensis TaxID=324855 RepID=A0ABP7RG51_9ACTN